MTRAEKIGLLLLAAAVFGMVLYDRRVIKSSARPVLVEEGERLAGLGGMVVGESGSGMNPRGAYYLTGNVPYGFPLPSMIPVGAGA